MPSITLQVEDPALPEVRALIAELDAYLGGLYPPESNHLMPIDELRRPEVVFLTVRVDGQVAGCGAFVHRGDYAEVKRMFVRPGYRGLRLGRQLLDELEARVHALGLPVVLLETGNLQTEALRLYERAGYTSRGPFGGYAPDRWTVFFEKSLTGGASDV